MKPSIRDIGTSLHNVTYDTIVPHAGNNGHPHMLHHGTLIIAAVIGISMIVGVMSLADDQSTSRLSADVYSSVLIDLTNESRAERNLPTLVKNDKLALAAQLKSEDMVTKNYFAHVSPEGLNSWYWFQKAGYVFSVAGENLAVNFSESEDVSRAWMDSPTHRANILNAGFTEIGIMTNEGMYKGKNTTFIVQMFGTPARVIAAAPVVQTTTSAIPVAKEVSTKVQKDNDVLGAIQVVSESSDEASTMIVVQNQDAQPAEIVSGQIVEPTVYTPWYQRLLINLSHPIGIALIVIGSLIGLSFILSVIYHKTLLHRVALGAIIAFVLVFLGYIYLSFAHEIAPLMQYFS